MRGIRAWVLVFAATMAAPLRAQTFLVLPFTNESSAPDLDWIGESIAESVRETLFEQGLMTTGREARLEVYGRLGIRERAPLTRATIIKVGEELDADQVIYGSFTFSPEPAGSPSRGTLRIRVRILDLGHMRQGPEFSEVGALEDLATLQTHLSWQTLQYLTPKTAPSEEDFRKSRVPLRLDAVENYIRGLEAESDDQKVRFFMQAARLDSRFSRPCFQLGQIYYAKKEYAHAAEWLGKVAPADAGYFEANFLLGLSRYHMGDYAGAEKSFELVAQSVPLNEVFNDLGAAQSRRHLPEALDSFRKALEGDPSDPVYHFNVGYALFRKGDFAGAGREFEAVLENNPDDEQAKMLLERCTTAESRAKARAPKTGASAKRDPRVEGLERLKTNYEERAWRQLKAVLQRGKK